MSLPKFTFISQRDSADGGLHIFNNSRVFKVGNVKSAVGTVSFLYEELLLPELAPGKVKYLSLTSGQCFDFYTGLVRGFSGPEPSLAQYGGQFPSGPLFPAG